jgi:hypothetical protein
MTIAPGFETQSRLEMMFSGSEREEAVRLLSDWDVEGDRVRIAALKVSDGNIEKLKEAIAVGKNDWRDILYSAGFANDTKKHLRWIPGQVEKSWFNTLIDRFKR